MKTLFGAAFGAAALMVVGSVAVTPAAAAGKSTTVQQDASTPAIQDFSAQRRYRRYYRGPRYYYGPRYYRPYAYQPYGYGNPYYRPYGYYGGGPRFYGPGFGFSFGL